MSKNRDLILQSAKHFFSFKSFDEVTVTEICQHAGVANSTFFYHFKTKSALIECLRDSDLLDPSSDLLNIISCPDLLEQVIAACSLCAMKALRSGPMLCAQYYKQRIFAEDPGDAHRQRTAEKLETARAFIARAQQEGIIKNKCSAEQLACAAIRMINGVIIEWCAANGSFDLLQRCRELLLVFFDIQ